MPLDPQAKALLDEFAAAGAPPPWEVPLADLRAGFDELSAALAAPAPEVARVEDRTVPGPDGAIPIRLYWPESDGDGALPVLVHFHGGGFVLLGLDAYDPICKMLCAGADCIVVGVGYRKAPENKFPKAADDSWAATRWVAANCAEFGGDAGRIAVAGDSAGGCLAAGVTHRARAAGGPALVFQLLVYPLTDFAGDTASYRAFGEDHLVTTEMMNWYAECYLNDETEKDDPLASPLRSADFAGLPPAFILTAGCDPLRDEGVTYGEKLRAAGVPVEHRDYPDQIHVFWSFGARIDAAADAHAEACAALRRAFGTR